MDSEVSGGDRFRAFLAYLPVVGILALVFVLLVFRPQSRFLLFHTRQGLYLFSTALVAMLVLLGLFYVSDKAQMDLLSRVFAVMVAMVFIAYVVAALLLAGASLQKRMTMLPVLGELAGER